MQYRLAQIQLGVDQGEWAYYYLVVPITKELKLHESLQL